MTLLSHIGAIVVICAICIPFLVWKSKKVDPSENKWFDEADIYSKPPLKK